MSETSLETELAKRDELRRLEGQKMITIQIPVAIARDKALEVQFGSRSIIGHACRAALREAGIAE